MGKIIRFPGNGLKDEASGSGYSYERIPDEPADDLLGLSPRRVFTLADEGAAGLAGFLELRDAVRAEDVPAVPLLSSILSLLGLLIEGGPVKATGKGNLPRPFVWKWWDVSYGPRLAAQLGRPCERPHGEESYLPLRATRFIAQKAGLVKFRLGQFSATAKGTALFAAKDYSALYRRLFFATGWDYEWNLNVNDACVFYPLLQKTFAFNLYLFGRLARTWIDEEELVDAYVRAFPFILDDFLFPDGSVAVTALTTEIGRGLLEFPGELGLTLCRGEYQPGGIDNFQIQTTELFDRLLAFTGDE